MSLKAVLWKLDVDFWSNRSSETFAPVLALSVIGGGDGMNASDVSNLSNPVRLLFPLKYMPEDGTCLSLTLKILQRF